MSGIVSRWGLIFLMSLAFSQEKIDSSVPDSVIVQKMAEIKAEYEQNEVIIKRYQDRQAFLNASHIALFDLIKEEDEVEEEK